MKTKHDLKNIDVVILAGGTGTRLSSVVKDVPKALAPINGVPFIDILVDNFVQQGFQRFILCIGYLHEKIISHCQKWNHLDLNFSIDEIPLGTGGAIKNAEPLIQSDNFIVQNGDSYCHLDYLNFFTFHIARKSQLSVTVTKLDKTEDYGQIELDIENRIVSFHEKDNMGLNKFTNSGIYLFNKVILNNIPFNKNYSNEYELIPTIIKHYNCYGYIIKNKFWDIGTPERYEFFLEMLRNTKK